MIALATCKVIQVKSSPKRSDNARFGRTIAVRWEHRSLTVPNIFQIFFARFFFVIHSADTIR